MMMMELEEEGFLPQLSDEVLLTIVKCAYDAHDVVLADAENRSLPAATKPVALVEVMSVLGLVSHRWRRMAGRQRHTTVFGGAPFPHLQPPFPLGNSRGCQAKVAPADREAHLEVCEGTIVPCEAADAGCSWSGPRKELTTHTGSCPTVPMRGILLRLNALEKENARLEEKNVQEMQSYANVEAGKLLRELGHMRCAT